MKTAEEANKIMDRLRQEAVDVGICKQGLAIFDSQESLEGLVAYYIENPDWCIERGFPSLELMRKMSAMGWLEGTGVFVDRCFNGELLNKHQAYIFHHCSGIVRTGLNVEEEIIPMFYLANESNLAFAGGFPERLYVAKVPLYRSEDSVTCMQDGNGVIFTISMIKSVKP